MHTPGFNAEQALYRPAIGPAISRPGGIGVLPGDNLPSPDLPPLEISSACVTACLDQCSDLCLLRPNPVRCFINRCVPNCRQACVGT
mgnify:CR=1 FL=1